MNELKRRIRCGHIPEDVLNALLLGGAAPFAERRADGVAGDALKQHRYPIDADALTDLGSALV